MEIIEAALKSADTFLGVLVVLLIAVGYLERRGFAKQLIDATIITTTLKSIQDALTSIVVVQGDMRTTLSAMKESLRDRRER
jgi:hypothetical protein